jgi:phosphoglycerate dehydrogenase-like enzyme
VSDPFQVHLYAGYDAGFVRKLRSLLTPGIRLTSGDEEPGDFRVLVAGRPDRSLLMSSGNLEALVIPWAGLPETTAAVLTEFPGLRVYSIHHNADAAAEMAVSLMLAAARRIIPAHEALRRGDWTSRYAPGDSMLVGRSRILVLGWGAIGRRVGTVCRSMGASVKGIRLHADPSEEAAGVYPPSRLHDMLPETDILVVCLPLTPMTRGMIGEEELALLPPHAVLVNVGRGEVVPEETLYLRLKSGSLGAAGIDVWYSYPDSEESRMDTMPSAYPFHELDNVVMSPHRAGAHGIPALEELRAGCLAETLNVLAAGGEPPGAVDPELGY